MTTTRQTKKELLASARELEQRTLALERRLELVSAERDRLEERSCHAERLVRQLGTLNERFELLAQLQVDVNALNLDKICEVCVTRIPYVLNAHHASIYLLDETGEQLVLKRHSHHRALEHVIPLTASDRSLMARVTEEAKVRVFQDLDHVERPGTRPGGQGDGASPRPHQEQYASRSCIVAPLTVGEHLVGVLNLSDPVDGIPFTESEDHSLVERIAAMLALGIRNCHRFAELELLARTDSLTGLANHKTFFETLRKEAQRASRYGSPLTVAMVDVDNFKLINDHAGHLAGDAILEGVARILAESVRLPDTAARYGGDEFALILPESDRQAAAVVAERIRERVARTRFTFEGRNLVAHVSLGLAPHDTDLDAAELVRRADQALYRAKGGGGDRLSVFEERGSRRRLPQPAKAARKGHGRRRPK